MPDMSPERWLSYLIEKLESRLVEMSRLRDYADGNPPLPKGATQYREAYAEWQKMSRTNFAGLSVEAPAERIRISGFRVGGEGDDNDAARALWRRSQGGACASDIHRDALTYGHGYGMASAGRFGALLTRCSPFSTITEHDPVDATWVEAGLRMWQGKTTDHAVLHLPGQVWRFVRDAQALPDGMRPFLPGGEWSVVPGESGPSSLERVPIVRFTNRDGLGEFAKHTDLLDRINWVILQRLLIVGMQAFRQRALEEDAKNEGALDETDENGDDIDWNEAFIPGPDALWVLPPGVKIWESQPGDIQQILSAAKDDIGQFAAVTRTPMSTFMPGDGENQTAEGAAFAREGLVFKAEDRIERFTSSWDTLVPIGLQIDGINADVQTQWAPAERQSLAEKFDALAKSGDLPWRRRMTDILGYSADVVDQMEIERARDAVLAASITDSTA